MAELRLRHPSLTLVGITNEFTKRNPSFGTEFSFNVAMGLKKELPKLKGKPLGKPFLGMSVPDQQLFFQKQLDLLNTQMQEIGPLAQVSAESRALHRELQLEFKSIQKKGQSPVHSY